MPRVTITIPENSPKAYDFDLYQEVVTVGRRDDNDIVVGSGSVSGKHAEIHRVKGAFHLIDAGSTNGTSINGVFHATVVLQTGMTVNLGDVEFVFSLNEQELAALASEMGVATTPVIGAEEEQARAEQARAEQARAEQARAEQARAEQARAEQAQAEKAQAEKALAEKALAEKALAEKALAEKALAEKAQVKKAQAEKKEQANKEAIAKKAGKAEKRKRPVRPANSDEYYESKTLKVGSGVALFVLIAIAAAFLYGGITHDRNGTGENIANTTTDKDGAKNEAPTEVGDKPNEGAK